jgi:hypothetical protein
MTRLYQEALKEMQATRYGAGSLNSPEALVQVDPHTGFAVRVHPRCLPVWLASDYLPRRGRPTYQRPGSASSSAASQAPEKLNYGLASLGVCPRCMPLARYD